METSPDLQVVDIRWDNLDITKFLALSVTCNVMIKTLVYPTIVAKTRIQVESTKNGAYQSSWRMLRTIGATEGIRGLYRGLPTAMFGFVFPQSAYIYTYEKTRDHVCKDLQKRSSAELGGKSPAFIGNMVGGATAAVVATLMNTPVDVIAQRLQLQGASSTVAGHRYNGGMHAFYMISAQEGVRGLYRGLGATLISFVPSSAIWWAVYGALRTHVYPMVFDKGIVAETAGNLACGVLSGWASVCLLNPLDVAKTRLQTQEQRAGNPRNIFSMAWTILRTEGVAAIWVKGLTARMTGTAMFSAWTIAMYEIVKKVSYVNPPTPSISSPTEENSV
jgi:solute carrier family 25 protein 44